MGVGSRRGVQRASMRPPQNAGESVKRSKLVRRAIAASMRPPQNAGESIAALEVPGYSGGLQ